MKRLSVLPAPALAGVVRREKTAAAIAEIRNCSYDGADMIDLHLSCLQETDIDTLRRIIASTVLPTLALHYNNYADWTPRNDTEEERAALLLRAVDAGAAGVDMQGYTFDAKSKSGFFGEDRYSFTKGNPKEVVTDAAVIERQNALIQTVHEKGAEVLLSCHPGIPMNSTQVVELALFLEKRNPDIVKIVTVAENEDDLIESFKAMSLLRREVKTKVAYHAGGKAGTLSRIINPILGGQVAFCIDRYSASSLPEQIDLRTARSIVDGIAKIGR